MEMLDLITRYEGRAVEIVLHNQTRIQGEVASVFAECIRLTDSTVFDAPGDLLSFDRKAETSVPLHCICAVTCLDDSLRDAPPPGVAELAESRGSAVKTGSQTAADADDCSPIRLDRLEVCLGVGLLQLVSPQCESGLLGQIPRLREGIGKELGVPLPKVRIRDSLSLEPLQYSIAVNGVVCGCDKVQPGKYLAIPVSGKGNLQIAGENVREPAFGKQAWWISREQRRPAEVAGFTVVDAPLVIAAHLRRLAVEHAGSLLSLQDVSKLLSDINVSDAAVVELAVGRGGLSLVHRVLCALVAERVSVARLPVILESVVRHLPSNTTADNCSSGLFLRVLERVRADIRSGICAELCDCSGCLKVAVLSDMCVSFMTEVCHLEELAAQRTWMRSFAAGLTESGAAAVVVEDHCRYQVSAAIRAVEPGVHVLARSEIPPTVELHIVEFHGPEFPRGSAGKLPR